MADNICAVRCPRCSGRMEQDWDIQSDGVLFALFTCVDDF